MRLGSIAQAGLTRDTKSVTAWTCETSMGGPPGSARRGLPQKVAELAPRSRQPKRGRRVGDRPKHTGDISLCRCILAGAIEHEFALRQLQSDAREALGLIEDLLERTSRCAKGRRPTELHLMSA